MVYWLSLPTIAIKTGNVYVYVKLSTVATTKTVDFHAFSISGSLSENDQGTLTSSRVFRTKKSRVPH